MPVLILKPHNERLETIVAAQERLAQERADKQTAEIPVVEEIEVVEIVEEVVSTDDTQEKEGE